jgi:hypothetical protein
MSGSPRSPRRLGAAPAPTLLSRVAFRAAVFARDQDRCVVCRGPGSDAHHIVERRLWPDGGYYLANGALLCADCHLAAERTTLSCETIRMAAGIVVPLLPPHLDPEDAYDKWGNLLLPSGARLRGELFADTSVQKVLAEGGVLPLFLPYVKYPRTPHFAWSEGVGADDLVLQDLSAFAGTEVVVTPKYDGESTSCYRDRLHARSIDSGSHSSQDWLRREHAAWRYELPEGWRLCGENLYAAHTYRYAHLPARFLGYSVWTDANMCLDWDSTVEWCALLGVTSMPELYRGPWDEARVRACLTSTYRGDPLEGYVVRTVRRFSYAQFRTHIAKVVTREFKEAFQRRAHDQGKRRVLVPNAEGAPPAQASSDDGATPRDL